MGCRQLVMDLECLDPGHVEKELTHPSTALCLRWLAGLDLAGSSMLDYGSGSGISAIAALSFGAKSALAFDSDSQAPTPIRETAQINGVENRLSVTQDVAEVTGGFDIVVASILAEPLVQRTADFSDRVAPQARSRFPEFWPNKLRASSRPIAAASASSYRRRAR